MSGFSRKRHPRLHFRGKRFFVSAIVVSALLSVTVAPSIRAQTDPNHPWLQGENPGRVLVDLHCDEKPDGNNVLEIEKGQSGSYCVKLNKAPIKIGERLDWEWWVTVSVDCDGYGNGRCLGEDDQGQEIDVIEWIPSYGRTFRGDWDTWKNFTIDTHDHAPNAMFTFSHHVWDDATGCPAVPAIPVWVRVVDEVTGGDGNGNGNGNGNGGRQRQRQRRQRRRQRQRQRQRQRRRAMAGNAATEGIAATGSATETAATAATTGAAPTAARAATVPGPLAVLAADPRDRPWRSRMRSRTRGTRPNSS